MPPYNLDMDASFAIASYAVALSGIICPNIVAAAALNVECPEMYDGKLFDTDVHHAKGKSEAIFIDDGKFFSVLPTGEKKLLHSR